MTKHPDTDETGTGSPLRHSAIDPLRWTVARGLGLAFFAVLVFALSAGGLLYQDLSSDVAGGKIDTSGLGATDQPTATVPPDSFDGRAVNILISGIDSRYNQGADSYGSSKVLSTINSDTTMIVHISKDRKRVQVISIPRDTWTTLPACKRSNGTTSAEQEGQFNWAFSIGAVTDDVASGIACTQAAATKVSGITPDGFVVVDFKGFQGMIDALGGVTLCVPQDIDDRAADLKLQKGCQKLNSKQALGYARVRKSVGDGSDLQRIGRQQQLVGALVSEAMSQNYVSSFPKMYGFVKSVLRTLQTSSSLSSLTTDAALAYSLRGIDRANVQFVTMPYTTATFNANRVVAKQPDADLVWQAVRADKALPEGTAYKDGTNKQHVVGPHGSPRPSGWTPADETPSGTATSSSDEQSVTSNAQENG